MTSPELREVGREFALLALARAQQDGSLLVRQRDQLHRALFRAAEELNWVLVSGSTADRITRVTKDVAVLADAGAHSLESDLAAQIAVKEAEIQQLKRVAHAVQKLATDANASWPAEIEYSHTARHGPQNLVTKTETLTLDDANAALDAAASLEKGMESRARLCDQMLEELKGKQRQVEQMRDTLSGFLDASRSLIGEVLASTY